MPIPLALRENQTSELTWSQVDGNFSDLASAITASVFIGGTTSSRPTTPAIFTMYFDSTIGLPIWCASVAPVVWVNAAGIVV